jgi:hypothetical protein
VIVGGECVIAWKKAVMVYFDVMSWHLPEETEENHETFS